VRDYTGAEPYGANELFKRARPAPKPLSKRQRLPPGNRREMATASAEFLPRHANRRTGQDRDQWRVDEIVRAPEAHLVEESVTGKRVEVLGGGNSGYA